LHPRLFFEACDGIFLNYTWNIECLTRSLTEAKNRPLDVYVGIDVFGRNCYGGGGFNTNAALSVVRQYGLSAAIFAPGWVYECHDIGIFPSINTEFWLLLLPYLSVKGLNRLPIETSFCPGFGKAKFRCGKVRICCFIFF
jgi:mannosyl-glycoprotein endo-beta-N-acetylglucosaminidase